MTEQSKAVVLVSGATGALGSALIERIASDGAGVVALERSRGSDVTVDKVDGKLVRVHAPTDPAALTLAVARAEAELGPITGAVLTAGAWRGGHKFHEPAAASDYRVVMDANLESAQLLLRALLPGMVQRQHGSVILIGSRSGVRPYSAPGDAAYAASKAALIALAQAVAAEVLGDGVRINVVLPATIDTQANRQAMPTADHSRWVSTESFGDVVQFLLSSGARDISGATLPVYGRASV